MNQRFTSFDVQNLSPDSRRHLRGAQRWRADWPSLMPKASTRKPLHPFLVGLGSTLLIGVSITDVAYENSPLPQWENFSTWLLTAGLAVAAAALLFLLIDIALRRARRIAWPRFSGFALAVALSVLNVLVHSRDAYTAVVPQGLALSVIVAAVLIGLGLRGWRVDDRSNPQSVELVEIRS